MKKYILVILSTIFLLVSCNNNTDLVGTNKIFRDNEKYYVLYEGNLFELPKNVKLTTNKTIDEYFTNGILKSLNIEVFNKTQLLNDLNKYFDNGIQYVSKNEVVQNPIQIPLLTTSDGVYIDSLRFEQIMKEINGNIYVNNTENKAITNENTNANINLEELLNGKTVEILNANNINGFARQIGERLSDTYGINYNAENYTQKEISNYVIQRDMTDQEITAILNVSGLKYIKVMEDTGIKQDANFILITGLDSDNGFEVEIVSNMENSTYTPLLNEYNLVNNGIVETYNGENISSLSKGKIYYNAVDKFTALVLLEKLGVNNFDLVEQNELNNKIVLVVNR